MEDTKKADGKTSRKLVMLALRPQDARLLKGFIDYWFNQESHMPQDAERAKKISERIKKQLDRIDAINEENAIEQARKYARENRIK